MRTENHGSRISQTCCERTFPKHGDENDVLTASAKMTLGRLGERRFPKHGDENPNCNEALFIAFFVCSERIFLKHGGRSFTYEKVRKKA